MLYLEHNFKPLSCLHIHQTALMNLVSNVSRLKCLSSREILLLLNVQENKK